MQGLVTGDALPVPFPLLILTVAYSHINSPQIYNQIEYLFLQNYLILNGLTNTRKTRNNGCG